MFGQWRDGKKCGIFETYYPSGGEIESRTTFVDDIPHGWHEDFDEGGNLLKREGSNILSSPNIKSSSRKTLSPTIVVSTFIVPAPVLKSSSVNGPENITLDTAFDMPA